MDDVYNDLETEKEHTAFLEELLKTLYGPGWDELTLFDAKKWHNYILEMIFCKKGRIVRHAPEGGEMKIEKVYAIKHEFIDRIGPTEVITLGLKSDKLTLILGSFYYGPCMPDNADVECQKLEELIDHIVLHCGGGK